MRVDTVAAGLAAINAVTRGIAGGASPAAAGTAFGPSSLLSISGVSSGSALDGLYTALSGSLANRSAQNTPRVSPKQQNELNKQMRAALALADAGNVDQAREQLKSIAAKNPSSGVAVHSQGVIELTAGNYEAAERFFRKADFLDASLGAADDVENARVLQKSDKAVLDRANRLLADANTRKDGTNLLNLLAKRSPRDASVRIKLGDVALQDRDVLNAALNYSRATGIASKEQLGEIEGKLQGLLKQTKDEAFVQNLLGRTQLKLGKLDEALATLHAATEKSDGRIEYREDEAKALVAIGREKLKRGDVSAALTNIEAAFDLDPSGDEVHLARADGYVARAEQRTQSGNLNGAIDDFDKAARAARRRGGEETLKRVAAGVYAAGRRLESRRDEGDEIGREITAFQAAYDIDPTNRIYRTKLAETRKALGDQYLAEDNFKDAALSYKRAFELDKQNADYKDAALNAFSKYGEEELENRRFDTAITAYRNMFEISGKTAESRTQLADVYNQAGVYYRDLDDDERAATYFSQALSLFPDNDTYRTNYESVS